MTPYIILVVIIFLFRGWSYSLPEKKRNGMFLTVTFLYLYVFCVLRSFDVGRDIDGYVEMYHATAHKSWSNWDYVYFENGYIALMKLCNMIGLSARGFFYVVYFIILYPLYLLLKKYSPAPLMSVILFVTYQFFAFDLTGLRQAIAMSVCMLAFMVAMKPGRKHMLLFFLLVYLASFVHRSSLIFVFAYFLMRIPITAKTCIFYICGAVLCHLLNAMGVAYVLELYDNTDYTFDNKLLLGAGVVLMGTFAVCSVYTQFRLKSKHDLQINQYCTNLLMAGFCLMLLFNGSNLLRAAMYYYFTLLISLAFVPKVLDRSGAFIYTVVLYVVLLTSFFTASELYHLDLLPYEIGVQQAITK